MRQTRDSSRSSTGSLQDRQAPRVAPWRKRFAEFVRRAVSIVGVSRESTTNDRGQFFGYIRSEFPQRNRLFRRDLEQQLRESRIRVKRRFPRQ
jgi:hypothetical protein